MKHELDHDLPDTAPKAGEPTVMFLLVIVTLGIYTIFWVRRLARDINRTGGEQYIDDWMVTFYVMGMAFAWFGIISCFALLFLVEQGPGMILGIVLLVLGELIGMVAYVIGAIIMGQMAGGLGHIYRNKSMRDAPSGVVAVLLFLLIYGGLPYLQSGFNRVLRSRAQDV